DDGVRPIVVDLHTLSRLTDQGSSLRLNPRQYFTQLGAVVGKVEHDLSGRGVNCGAAARPKSLAQVAVGGGADTQVIGGIQVDVIEQIGDKAVRHGGRGTSTRGG